MVHCGGEKRLGATVRGAILRLRIDTEILGLGAVGGEAPSTSLILTPYYITVHYEARSSLGVSTTTGADINHRRLVFVIFAACCQSSNRCTTHCSTARPMKRRVHRHDDHAKWKSSRSADSQRISVGLQFTARGSRRLVVYSTGRRRSVSRSLH